MIGKRLAMIVLAATLYGCSDGDNDEGINQDPSQNVQEKNILKIESARDKKAQQPKRSPSGKAPLPLMMLDDSSDSHEEDLEDIDIEEIEQYREDYDKAVDVDEKAEALAALVQADEKNALVLLQEAYDSPEAQLRKEAVLQMQDFSDDEEGVDLLLRALDDPEPEVVLEAVEGLSGVDSARAREGLKKLAQSHPDKSVREAAREYVEQESEEKDQSD